MCVTCMNSIVNARSVVVLCLVLSVLLVLHALMLYKSYMFTVCFNVLSLGLYLYIYNTYNTYILNN